MDNLQAIRMDYNIKKDRIKQRLNQFKEVLNSTDEAIFEELVFCILTANTSAKMALNSIEAIRPYILEGTVQQISSAIKGKYIYWNIRPQYIVSTRDYLKKEFNFKLKEKILSFKDKQELRDFFALNKNIKGVGFKEASHFLRNIGFNSYAILDKHIINTLFENKIIEINKRPTSKKQYIELEQKYFEFAELLQIDPDELDLLLWSRKNGQILK